MIEIAVASIPFVLFMYLILRNRESGENYARHTDNDSQDIPEADAVNNMEHESTINSSQERDPEFDPGHCTSDEENVPSATPGRTDMLILLVYYYRTIVKIIELIMSKKALRRHQSRRDNYESMIPLSRSSKECDLLAPTTKHEEDISDDTDEDQDWDEEFVMKHQEASIDNLEVFIAQRRKIETYLQQCKDNDIDISSSEEVENIKKEHEIITLDEEKSLRTESELVAALIDEVHFDESESENSSGNSLVKSSDEVIDVINKYMHIKKNTLSDHDTNSPQDKDKLSTELETQFEKHELESDISEKNITIRVSDIIVDTDHGERDVSDYDMTLKESENNYQADSEISDTLIAETVNDDLQNLQCFEKSSNELQSDEMCRDEIIIGEEDTCDDSGIIDTNAKIISLDEEIAETSKDNIFETLQEAEYRIDSESANIILRTSEDICESKSYIPCNIVDENINESLEGAYIAGEKNNDKTNNNENTVVASGIIDTKDKSISLDITFVGKSKENIFETQKESKHTHDSESALVTLKESEDSCELKNDIQCDINESLESAYMAGERSNEKTKNIENQENISVSKVYKGDDDINDTTIDQIFEQIYEDSIQGTLENIYEYEETPLNEPLHTEGLSKDIDNISNISIKKSFRNKGKRRKCTHKTVKKTKVSHNENEDEDNDDFLLNEENCQSDLQESSSLTEMREDVQSTSYGPTASLTKSCGHKNEHEDDKDYLLNDNISKSAFQDSNSETEIREEVQPAMPHPAVVLSKSSGRDYLSDYMLLKEIEQVELLIREAVNESDLPESFIVEIFQNEDNILEPIKEETAEETNDVSNGEVIDENQHSFDKDEFSFTNSKTVSDDDKYKNQDTYDIKEAHAICEYEEVSEDLYETFCDESDFMVPVIKRDEEWWTTLEDRDSSQFETVGDKNKAFTNLESITMPIESQKKVSVPKKVSFRADNELATIILDNVVRKSPTEYENYLFDEKEICTHNEESLFPPEFRDFEIQLEKAAKEYNTYDIDTRHEGFMDIGLSSYKTIGNLVSVDEYDTQSKYTNIVDDYLHDSSNDNLDCSHHEMYSPIFLTENDSFVESLYNDSLVPEKKVFLDTDDIPFEFDTISTMDDCKAFEADIDNNDDSSLDVSYVAVAVDEPLSNFINLSNIDICTAYKAVGGSDFTEWSTIDSLNNDNTPNHEKYESEEKENEVNVQDTFLDKSFLVAQNTNQLKNENISDQYLTPSLDVKDREIYSGGELHLDHKTNNQYEPEYQNTHCNRNEILNKSNLSSYEDENDIKVELYQSSSRDRVDVVGSDIEMKDDNRVSTFDIYGSNIDKCNAFNAINVPFKIEDVLVSKIIELEIQMKNIESYLVYSNNTVDPNISETNILSDKYDRFSASPSSYVCSDHPVNIYKPEDSYNGISKYLKNEKEYEYLETNISYFKIDQCKAFQAEDIHKIEIQQEIFVDNDDFELSNPFYSEMDQCTAFYAEEIQKVVSQPKVVSNENISPSSHERCQGRINAIDHFELLNLNYSKIDKCTAFNTDEIQEVTPQPKEVSNENISSSSHEICQGRLDAIDHFELLNLCYSKIDKCTACCANEIQEVTSHGIHLEILKDDDLCKLSSIFYSKLDQCKAFKACNIDIKTIVPAPKKSTQSSIINSINNKEDIDSSTPVNLQKETIFFGEESLKMIDPVIAMGPTTDYNNPVVEIAQVGGIAPVVTLSKEESDYVLSVKLEKFKNLQLLQNASVSQDNQNHK